MVCPIALRRVGPDVREDALQRFVYAARRKRVLFLRQVVPSPVVPQEKCEDFRVFREHAAIYSLRIGVQDGHGSIHPPVLERTADAPCLQTERLLGFIQQLPILAHVEVFFKTLFGRNRKHKYIQFIRTTKNMLLVK